MTKGIKISLKGIKKGTNFLRCCVYSAWYDICYKRSITQINSQNLHNILSILCFFHLLVTIRGPWKSSNIKACFFVQIIFNIPTAFPVNYEFQVISCFHLCFWGIVHNGFSYFPAEVWPRCNSKLHYIDLPLSS